MADEKHPPLEVDIWPKKTEWQEGTTTEPDDLFQREAAFIPKKIGKLADYTPGQRESENVDDRRDQKGKLSDEDIRSALVGGIERHQEQVKSYREAFDKANSPEITKYAERLDRHAEGLPHHKKWPDDPNSYEPATRVPYGRAQAEADRQAERIAAYRSLRYDLEQKRERERALAELSEISRTALTNRIGQFAQLALRSDKTRWGVLTAVSSDAGPYKTASFSLDGKAVIAQILEFPGVESNPIVGSLAVIFSPNGDDGRAVALVAPPPAQRVDQQEEGEASFVNPLTGNVIQHQRNFDTIAKTAGKFRINPVAGKKIVRLGDIGKHAGVPKGFVTSASDNYMAEGQWVARVGDIFTCTTHGPNPILLGSSTHINTGKGVARDGDMTTCGAVLVSSALITEVD